MYVERMPSPRRVAIVINLNWTMKHHYEVFGGTQEFARERGWDSELWPYAPDLVDAEGRPKFDGIIARATPQLQTQADRAGIPLVNVWLSSPAVDVTTVATDMDAAGKIAAEHLVSRGFRRFGYVGFRRTKSSRILDRGFRRVVREAGSGNYSRILNSTAYCDSHSGWVTFQREIGEWIDSVRPPIGILAVTDKLARYVIDAARTRGIDVPGEMAVIGLENEEVVCMNPEPSITSIDLGFHQVGRRAAEVLEQMMAGKPAPASGSLLPPVALIPRRSTDAYDVADADVAQALRFISENCHRPIRVRDVIAQAALSERSMERRFKDSRGVTIAAELTRMRIERAKRLLAETDLLVKQVSEACGFSDTRRLCEVFARDVGHSPEQFRSQRRAAAE